MQAINLQFAETRFHNFLLKQDLWTKDNEGPFKRINLLLLNQYLHMFLNKYFFYYLKKKVIITLEMLLCSVPGDISSNRFLMCTCMRKLNNDSTGSRSCDIQTEAIRLQSLKEQTSKRSNLSNRCMKASLHPVNLYTYPYTDSLPLSQGTKDNESTLGGEF